jgi:hypothetical protein
VLQKDVLNHTHSSDVHFSGIAQSDHELGSSEPLELSREFLESSYATVVSIPNHHKLKASGLRGLGRVHHGLYQKEGDGADLEKAIFLHETALQCTTPFRLDLVKDAHDLSLTLINRFQQGGDIVPPKSSQIYKWC